MGRLLPRPPCRPSTSLRLTAETTKRKCEGLPDPPGLARQEEPVAVRVGAVHPDDARRAAEPLLSPRLSIGQGHVARAIRAWVERPARAHDRALSGCTQRESVPVDAGAGWSHAAVLELLRIVRVGDLAEQRRRGAAEEQAADVPRGGAESR